MKEIKSLRARVEEVLMSRAPRVLDSYEQKEDVEHCFTCLECARAKLEPQRFKRCDASRVWASIADAYTFEIDKNARDCSWCKTRSQHARKVAEQSAQHPELHRRYWEGVEWSFAPDRSDYTRMQWCVSTFQIVRGDGTGVEQLIYHTYSDCE